tara:strand:- start:198 stop:1124 length:927 start_codon:yes stop_codon:yes gene_type:complete
MLKIYQQTINSEVTFNGIGLHSGKISNVKLLPAEVDTGIIFKRVDLNKKNIIKANYNNISSTTLCSTLKNFSGTKVSTIEHLLAAFYINGIDNVIVEIDNEEVPIMDGSSKEFIKILKSTGTKNQKSKRKYLKILEKVELENETKKIVIEPSEMSFEVEFQLNFNNPIIGNQKNCVNFSYDNLEDIYSSRTFCLLKDIEKIKKIGLAKGGSLQNAIVVGEDKILNEEGLRNENEFVNHKILDLAGDFLLSGYRILGKVNCYEGGHNLSNIFLKKLLNSKPSFALIEIEDNKSTNNNKSQESFKIAVNA